MLHKGGGVRNLHTKKKKQSPATDTNKINKWESEKCTIMKSNNIKKALKNKFKKAVTLTVPSTNTHIKNGRWGMEWYKL